MELRHLRYFLAIAEEMSVTRAAARLGINQPPLSQQLQQLEAEIGAPLFHRLARGMALTEAGRRLEQEARGILTQVEQAIENTRRAATGEIGLIRIGFTSSATFNPFVTRVIRDFRAEYQKVAVQLREETTANLLGLLQSGALDAGFIRPSPGQTGSLGQMLLFREPMLVALPVGHRLEKRRRIPLSELAEETFILYPRRNGSALYDAITDACQAAGFMPRIGQEAPQMASTVSLVAAGLGVSIVPASMEYLHTPGVIYRRISGDAPRAAMSLVYQEQRSSAVIEAFRRLVLARMGAVPGVDGGGSG